VRQSLRDGTDKKDCNQPGERDMSPIRSFILTSLPVFNDLNEEDVHT